jgi:hypothetical protein
MEAHMAREFTHTDGKKWMASETGAYFGQGAVKEGERVQATVADLDFECEDGRLAFGTMARGYVDRASEVHLREALQEALDTAAQ